MNSSDWEEAEARSFLGYAPVLEALSQYLDARNYVALRNEIEALGRADGGTRSIWSFLLEIIEGVLEREQSKLLDNLPEHVKRQLPGGPESLYGVVEQTNRLIARALGLPPPDTSLSPEIAEAYEESVHQILSEHPFIGRSHSEFANVVFRDYLLARALVKGPVDYRVSVRNYALSSAVRPSPLLARFLLELSEGPGALKHVRIADFSLIYESLRAQDAADSSISVSIRESDGIVEADILSPTGGHEQLVLTGDDPLEISRRLSDAQLTLETKVVALGTRNDSLTLGPNTSVSAQTIVVRASELHIETRDTSDGGVLLAGGNLAAEGFDTQIEHHGPKRLQIAVAEPLAYPWVQYRVETEPEPDEQEDPRLAHALNDLAALITWFKSEGYGGLGTYAKPLDAAAAKGRVSEDLLNFALGQGLVTKEGKLYYLHPGEFGVDLQRVKAKFATSGVKALLQTYLAKQG